MPYTVNDLNEREKLLAELAADLKNPPSRVPVPASDPVLAKFRSVGTQLWLDTGNLEEAAKLWKPEMTALTTNNTLANQVVQTGIMDDEIKEVVTRLKSSDPNLSPDDMVLDVVFVVNCQIALRLVSAFDAMVSVELHPAVSKDIQKTLRYAQRYYAVNPDRFIVKIPLTPEGYCAVAHARAEGIPINYTLGFSARQNYLAALLSKPNYCNIFLGRLNAVVSDNKLGDGKNVGERVTLASQQAVKGLREKDPTIPTHQIAASMRSADQMISLAGVDVYTIPPKAVTEFYAKGLTPDAIESKVEESYAVEFSEGTDKSSVEALWKVDEDFQKFAAELASRGGTKLTGDDLRAADADYGTRLFSGFTTEEQNEIRTKGKIPETARWADRASLDDLMTESALQSFIVDQDAFDARIRKIIAEA